MSAGERFLAALAGPAREPLPFRTTIVVAHPDDETIGCGALLSRLAEPTIIHLTDGAPRSLTDAKARGFQTAEAYAEARRRELQAAMALAGVLPQQLVALGWPDQEASFHMVEIATELARRLAGTDIVIAHAYEGGHPDHDTTALAVHAARELILRRGGAAPDIIEIPLYRAGPEGRLAQSFELWPGLAESVVKLSAEEQRLKEAMFAAHATQQHRAWVVHGRIRAFPPPRLTTTSRGCRMAATFSMSSSAGA